MDRKNQYLNSAIILGQIMKNPQLFAKSVLTEFIVTEMDQILLLC